MGKIINDSVKSDPLDVISIAGFGRFEDAFQYVLNGYDPAIPGNAIFIDKNFGRGGEQPFEETVFVVFSSPDNLDKENTLLGIIHCQADIPQVAVDSWGWQMLLTKLQT